MYSLTPTATGMILTDIPVVAFKGVWNEFRLSFCESIDVTAELKKMKIAHNEQIMQLGTSKNFSFYRCPIIKK